MHAAARGTELVIAVRAENHANGSPEMRVSDRVLSLSRSSIRRLCQLLFDQRRANAIVHVRRDIHGI